MDMLRKMWQEYKKNTREMTPAEKLEYTITYYWYHMLGLFAAVFLPVFLIVQIGFGKKEPEFTCVLVNQDINYGRDEELKNRFAEWAGMDEERVVIDSDYQISYEEVRMEGANPSSYEKFFFQWQNHELDAVIMPESFYRYCIRLGGEYRELDDFETAWLPLYEDGGKKTGVAVEETGLASCLVEDAGERVLLVFPESGEHPEACQKFLEFCCVNGGNENEVSSEEKSYETGRADGGGDADAS